MYIYRNQTAVEAGNVHLSLPDLQVLDVKSEAGGGLQHLHLGVHLPLQAEVVGDDEGYEAEAVPHRSHTLRQSAQNIN